MARDASGVIDTPAFQLTRGNVVPRNEPVGRVAKGPRKVTESDESSALSYDKSQDNRRKSQYARCLSLVNRL
jgi:hypothetical protein